MSIHPSITAMYGGSNTNCLYHYGIPIPVCVQLSCSATANSPAAAAATTSSDGTSDGGEHRINFNDQPEEFLMYIYKVKRCSKTRSHDWSLRPPRGEGAAPRPQKVPIQRHRLPGVPADKAVPAGPELRVRPRRLRVLSPPHPLPHPGVRGRRRQHPPHQLLRPHPRAAAPGGDLRLLPLRDRPLHSKTQLERDSGGGGGGCRCFFFSFFFPSWYEWSEWKWFSGWGWRVV